MNRRSGIGIAAVAFAAALAAPSPAASAAQAAAGRRPASLAGLWDASIVVNGAEVPFRMEIAGTGADTRGAFFNGDERVRSTHGSFDGASLVLDFDQYATKLEATLAEGRLEGRYNRGGTRGFYPF